jgi:hypothetical protein
MAAQKTLPVPLWIARAIGMASIVAGAPMTASATCGSPRHAHARVLRALERHVLGSNELFVKTSGIPARPHRLVDHDAVVGDRQMLLKHERASALRTWSLVSDPRACCGAAILEHVQNRYSRSGRLHGSATPLNDA